MKNKKVSFSKIAPLLIIVSVIFMCIGYASIDSISMNITGDVSAQGQDGIFITNGVYKSNVDADIDNCEIINMYQNLFKSNISLSSSNSNSSITYQITIYNSNDVAYAFSQVDYLLGEDTYSNEDIIFELDGLKKGDIIDSKGTITFNITFSYKDKVLSNNNVLKSLLNFKFEYVTSPVLASNMIPVVYENNSWKKIDSNSSNWHDYLNGKWANAITYNHSIAYNEVSNDTELKQFNGTSNDYVYLGAANYNFGHNITIVTRFKIYEYGTEVQGLVGNVESAGFYLGITAAGKIRFRIYESADVNKTFYSTEKIKLDTWYTIVVTYDGSVIRLYNNGILDNSLECTSDILVSDAPIVIGGNPNPKGITTSGFFKGAISEVAIMREALDEAEIIQNYGEKIHHIPTKHNVLYYLKFDADDGVVANSAKYESNGMSFDGIDDHISVGYSMYDFNNTFSIGARVKLYSHTQPDENTAREYSIFGNPQSGGLNLFESVNNKFAFAVYDSNTSKYVTLETDFTPSLDVWYTIISTYDGSTLRFYVDGEQCAYLDADIVLSPITTPFMIGVNPNLSSSTSGHYFHGMISDIILVDEALTGSQIRTYYSNSLMSIVSDKTLISYNLRAYEEREAGSVIPDEMINTMWTWVPRFSAKNPTVAGTIDLEILPIGERAHDAFTFDNNELDGFWIGKFENSAERINGTLNSNILIKPNYSSLVNKNIGTNFNMISDIVTLSDIYGFDDSVDTHLIKSNEWGAVAYLAQSKYGLCSDSSCKELVSNDTEYVTGGANYLTNTSQSTTQNVYGVYDMNGGAEEFVMGNYNNTLNSLDGFSSLPDEKYMNLYTTSDAYLSNKLQHSLVETSSLFNSGTSSFVSSNNVWFKRDNLFSYSSSTGEASSSVGSRTTLIVK